MTWMIIRLVLCLAFIGAVLVFASRLAQKRGLGGTTGVIEVVARQRMGRASSVAVLKVAGGFLPRRVQQAAQTSILLTLVAAGLGVAVLPESALALRVDGVRLVPVADDVCIDLALAWRREDPSPALARLLRALEANGFTTPDVDLPPPPAQLDAPLGGTR